MKIARPKLFIVMVFCAKVPNSPVGPWVGNAASVKSIEASIFGELYKYELTALQS